MSLRDDDIKQLKACLAEVERNEAAGEKFNVDAFGSMLSALLEGYRDHLTEKQRLWVHGVHERLFDEPQYENLFSTGRAPTGVYGKTPTPAVLQKSLPKRPPTKRKGDT